MNPVISSSIKENKKKTFFTLDIYPIDDYENNLFDWRNKSFSKPKAKLKIATMFS